MRLKFIVSLLLLTFIFAQRSDPSKMPKIGVLQGTVIDSVTAQPLQYASVSLISQRTDEIVTGGITDEDGNIYDFAFGLNWNGIISDERVTRYK